MAEDNLQEGMLVRNPKVPEWGLGKVLQIRGSIAKVHFPDDDRDFRAIATDRVSLTIAIGESDPRLDNLPPFLGDRFDVKAKRVSFQDGLNVFNREFPRGFNDPIYLGAEKPGASEYGERNYKLAACQRYKEELGDGKLEALLAADKISELTRLAYTVTSKEINLLSPFETMAFRDGLMGGEARAKAFFVALADYLGAESPGEPEFSAFADAVVQLPVATGRARVATWPVLTILPFLADPTRFMFLKPEPTNEYADRLRWDIQYSSELRWVTYKHVAAMCDWLLERLRPLGARDYIDVQSFIWVIARYES